MLCNAVKCIKNMTQEDRERAISSNDSSPWAIERTCHYLKSGKCPRIKRFWENHGNPDKSSGLS